MMILMLDISSYLSFDLWMSLKYVKSYKFKLSGGDHFKILTAILDSRAGMKNIYIRI